MNEPFLRIGLIGVGVGAHQLLKALTECRYVRLTAAADVRQTALDRLTAEFGIRTFPSAEAMCDSSAVDAVWVASPNYLHAEHAIVAAERGKHVVVSGNEATVVSHISAANAAGEPIEADVANYFQLEDGKIVYMANFHDTVPFQPALAH